MKHQGTARTFDTNEQDFACSAGDPGVAKRRRRRLAGVVGLAVCVILFAGTAEARDPEQPLRIPLEPIGYQAPPAEFLLAGSAMLTLDFVDKDHLLITFNVRRLMKREADTAQKDDDRTVAAVLVELPTGKVLARTEWRLHDRWQYLWSLGRGRFLLRVRDNLSLLAPMAGVSRGDAFFETALLRTERHIVGLTVSSDGNLLTVETTKRPVGPGTTAEELTQLETAPVLVSFYRMIHPEGAPEKLMAVQAGAVRTKVAVALPMTTSGFLDVMKGGKDSWLFNFDEHGGKVRELAQFDTSCFPHATFVGPGEFVAFGCRGSPDKVDFAGFNLKGEEMWQQNFFEQHVAPTFAFAPVAGRFALGRTLVALSLNPESPLTTSLVVGQEVRVYQSYDGKVVFRIDCSPVAKAGQNFALSEDGMQLAVVRQMSIHHAATKDLDEYTEQKTAVEVHSLPPLSQKDRTEVAKAEALAPADPGGRMDLTLMRLLKPAPKDEADAGPPASAATDGEDGLAVAPAAPAAPAAPTAPVAPTAASAEPAGTAAASGDSSAAGDSVPEGPRKPPTLYGPDEKKKKPE